MPQSLRTVSDGEGSIQVLVHQDRTAGQRGPPADPFHLQAQVLNTHRVVPVDRTLVLQREDQVQVSAAAAHKGTAPLRSRHLKASIELAEVVLAQEALAASRVRMPRNRSSCGKRPCQVEKLRSERPRAWGE